MADYCRQCSIDITGSDGRRLADLEDGETWVVCDGCGYIRVNRDGECVLCDLKGDQPGHGPAKVVIL